MNNNSCRPKTLDELRNLDIAAAFREQRVGDGAATDPATQEICEAIFFAADVLQSTIIATHDARQGEHEYNP